MSFNNEFFDESDEDDEYDEFLFESIQRYNTLQMFNIENIPYHLFQLNSTSVCVACKRIKGDNSELLKLQLPDKLTLPPEEESRSKGSDFKVLSGVYTENLIHKVRKLIDDKVIASEQHTNCLKTYDIGLPGSKIEENTISLIPWKGSDFVVVPEAGDVICFKCCHEPLIQVDVLTKENIKIIKHPFQNLLPGRQTEKGDCCSENNNIKCEIIDHNLIAILNIFNGDLVLHDLRTENNFNFLPSLNENQSKEIWTLSEHDFVPNSFNYFGLISNRRSICVFDKRKNSIVAQSQGDNSPVENYSNMKLKFSSRGDTLSVSGLDSFVEVFTLSESDIQHIFTHNGHSPSNSSHIVTDHIWLLSGSKNFIISICDNKTLNCWDYNA